MIACKSTTIIALATVAAGLAGCSNTGPTIATGTLPLEKSATSTPRVDPACVSLASQIDGLRAEGSVDRLEKAATTGKSSNVQVKRATLAKQAELNRVNAEFQTRCGPAIPRAQAASAAPPTASAPVQAKAAATTATGN